MYFKCFCFSWFLSFHYIAFVLRDPLFIVYTLKSMTIWHYGDVVCFFSSLLSFYAKFNEREEIMSRTTSGREKPIRDFYGTHKCKTWTKHRSQQWMHGTKKEVHNICNICTHSLSLSISLFLNVSASTFGVLCEYSRKKHNCGAIHNARYCMNIRNIFRFLVFTYCELLAHCDAINKLQNRLCHKLKWYNTDTQHK